MKQSKRRFGYTLVHASNNLGHKSFTSDAILHELLLLLCCSACDCVSIPEGYHFCDLKHERNEVF